MDARANSSGNATARRALVFVIVSGTLLPLVIALVAVVPQGARGAIFEVGLLGAAAVALWGGVVAWHALQAGTTHVATAYAAAVLGLVIGITLVLLGISSAIGLFA